MSLCVVWLRRDLRLDDHPALNAASKTKLPVICLYVLEEGPNADWAPGSATKVWLDHSLKSFSKELEALNQKLIIRKGEAKRVLKEFCQELKVEKVFWNERYEPNDRKIDDQVFEELSDLGVHCRRLQGDVILSPELLKTSQEKPYQVFTPFFRAFLQNPHRQDPCPRVSELPRPRLFPSSLALESLDLLPAHPWAERLIENWRPGIDGARSQLKDFQKSAIGNYSRDRDFPAVRGTARLSPYLHFGEISPRRLWSHIQKTMGKRKGPELFLRELGWREFAHYLLFHFPSLPNENLKGEFDHFPWRSPQESASDLSAWQKGETGYPIIDAGMRELWQTGWMHNRVRMIVASFLVKHLRIHWLEGAKWFWDTLVDANLGNNTLGWQWAAGTGPDAAPYFRIFNPILQSKKFDPKGEYIKKWLPEYTDWEPSKIHEPWLYGNADPIIDHQEARKQALDAYEKIKKAG
ncbi:MAG: deoxyribodipyrimidine photo-lyase [Bradymonadales bacterium]|nr:MAG: deoxyribodipyrimidine photo-lyase [Bradymonadales bacterium]